jgi:hypothetical protein
MSYQGTRKVEAGYNASNTPETLVGYTACCVLGFFLFLSGFKSFQVGRMYPSGGQKGQALPKNFGLCVACAVFEMCLNLCAGL